MYYIRYSTCIWKHNRGIIQIWSGIYQCYQGLLLSTFARFIHIHAHAYWNQFHVINLCTSCQMVTGNLRFPSRIKMTCTISRIYIVFFLVKHAECKSYYWKTPLPSPKKKQKIKKLNTFILNFLIINNQLNTHQWNRSGTIANHIDLPSRISTLGCSKWPLNSHLFLYYHRWQLMQR